MRGWLPEDFLLTLSNAYVKNRGCIKKSTVVWDGIGNNNENKEEKHVLWKEK
jgi:hypothetical protein